MVARQHPRIIPWGLDEERLQRAPLSIPANIERGEVASKGLLFELPPSTFTRVKEEGNERQNLLPACLSLSRDAETLLLLPPRAVLGRLLPPVREFHVTRGASGVENNVKKKKMS